MITQHLITFDNFYSKKHIKNDRSQEEKTFFDIEETAIRVAAPTPRDYAACVVDPVNHVFRQLTTSNATKISLLHVSALETRVFRSRVPKYGKKACIYRWRVAKNHGAM